MSWLRILVLALVACAACVPASAQAYDPIAIMRKAQEAFAKGDAMPAKDRVKAYLAALEECTNAVYRGESGNDDIAEELYAESKRIAPPDMRGQVDNAMARYQVGIERPGRAMGLFQSALADSEFVKDPGAESMALVQLARAYVDQGQPANADIVLQRADALIARMPQKQRNEAILNMSAIAMSARFAQGDAAGVGAVWDRTKEVLKSRDIDSFGKMSAAWANIMYLNQIRDKARASEAEKIIRDNIGAVTAIAAARIPGQNTKQNRDAVVDCLMVLAAGDPITLAEDPKYGERYEKCSSIDGLTMGEMRLVPPRVFEIQGDSRALFLYGKEIEVAESVRASFKTGDRTGFFAGRWRAAYAGVLRIHARAAAASPTAYYSFTMALIASERARARQFGDLTGGNAGFTESKDMLDFLRALPAGAAVVVQTSQENELVTMSYFGGRYAASIMPITPSQLDKRVSDVLALVTRPNPDDPSIAPVTRALDAFSRDMLGPTRELLKDAKHIIVLADGALTRIPFGLFTATDEGDPLAVTAEISYALSLRSLRSPAVASNATGFFGAGDPDFPAVPPAAGFTQSQILDTARSSAATRVEGGTALFNRLRYSRQEISDIATTFDAGAADKLADEKTMAFTGATTNVVLGSQATETRAKQALPAARYLHFATHGLVAGDLGLSESAVVLAATAEDDGYLTASEVEKLKVQAALTVLSACNTGNGRVVAGEGVLGLARAFLLAGSRSAMVSLWSVDDESTTAFMIYFYGKLQEGLSPAAALRETASEMRGIYEHPAYWAAFTLISR